MTERKTGTAAGGFPGPPASTDNILLCDGCFGAATGLTAGCEDGCPRDLDHAGLCRRDSDGACQWCGNQDRLHDVRRADVERLLPAVGEEDQGLWWLHFTDGTQGPYPSEQAAWDDWHTTARRQQARHDGDGRPWTGDAQEGETLLALARGERRYVASWAEEKDQRGAGAASSWVPVPFGQAKAILLAELRRNLDLWRGIGGSDPSLYDQAIERLENAAGPLTITLPGHVLRIEDSQPGGAS